ncbi:hypothetical protein KFE25_004720 [Diacronema lutheri]|uniref:Uncharacterized protein n=1 Tax=Diacronema lutheri TaxID=2081491 RepID=A0A8J6C7F9_DIALT|nr:hypothetical protein KFE25_004720 [Diacronema lutheri]
MAATRIEIRGGFCVNRHIDEKLPEALSAAGIDEKNWTLVGKELGQPLARFFYDNFMFVGGALICTVPMIIVAALLRFWPVYLTLVIVWGLYFIALYRQEQITIPHRLDAAVVRLNERVFAAKGLELSYVKGACFGFGAHFVVLPATSDAHVA